MKKLNNFIFEKLKIDKEVQRQTKFNNEDIVNYIYDLTGAGKASDDLVKDFKKVISDCLYTSNIEKISDMTIYCDSKFDFFKRIDSIGGNRGNFIGTGKITFDTSIFPSTLSKESLVYTRTPFKIYSRPDGFLIRYQCFNDFYRIYVKKNK